MDEQRNMGITRFLVWILTGIFVNALGRYIALVLHLPFWLDSIGTGIIAALYGPLAGGLVGGISNIIYGFFQPDSAMYALTGIIIGVVIGKTYPRDDMDRFQIVWTAALTAICAIMVSTPINIFVNQGYTDNLWGDALFDMLAHNESSMIACALLGEAFVDFPDKVLTLFIVSGVIKLQLFIRTNLKKGEDK